MSNQQSQLAKSDDRARPAPQAGRPCLVHSHPVPPQPERLSLEALLPAQPYIDLAGLLSRPAAAEMLMLARGQLNCAFRKHGLLPPDPLPLQASQATTLRELDDPARGGMASAQARYAGVFHAWSSRLPAELAQPVLNILRQTLAALTAQAAPVAARTAVLQAHDFLLGCCDEG